MFYGFSISKIKHQVSKTTKFTANIVCYMWLVFEIVFDQMKRSLSQRRYICMTRNQIDWQNMLISGRRHKEDARHNLATETELNRSNLAREYLSEQEIEVKRRSLNESIRHNRIGEWLEKFKADETKRHNEMDETRNMLNVQLQHMDRAEANSITRAFNELSLATRELERLDKMYLGTKELDIKDRQVVNNYQVALKNWENEVRKTDIQKGLSTSQKVANYGRAYSDVVGTTVDAAKTILNVKDLLFGKTGGK